MTAELKIARGFALPLDLVTEATAIVATRGAGKSSASAVIVEEAFALGVQSVTFDRTGVYWGLRSNKSGDGVGLAIYVLGGPHGDVPLEAHAGALIADLVVDSGHSFVLDLSDFSKANAVKFAADFLERLYDRKARSRSTTLLVMDEAHFYAPQTPRGGFKGDSARLMGAMEDAVGLGRSRGLGVVLTTQRTQSLNKAILDLIETLLVMRMLSPRAREAVRLWIMEKHEQDDEGVIPTLDSLPTGTAWVWSPLRGILQRVALRRIKTFDSYATPTPGQVQAEPTVRKELDLSSLGEEMRATAERAKENDPAELRKRVRHLENELAKKPQVDEGFVVWANERIKELEEREPERVEVSVLTDEDRYLLGKLEVLAPSVSTAVSDLEELRSLIERAEAAARVTDPVRKPADSVRKSPPPRQAPLVLPEVQVTLPEETRLNGVLPPPQQKIVNAIRWFEELGERQPSRVQVALVAGYSARSGGFGNLLGKLSTADHITYPSSGLVALTSSGRALAVDPHLPDTNEGIQREIMARLPAPQAKLLRVLIDAYPDAITREELAARTGYSARSGGFGNLLGRLRTGALIDYPDRGHVVALDVLFPMR